MRKVILGSLIMTAVVAVPFFATMFSPWAEVGQRRSVTFAVVASAVVFLLIFIAVLRINLTTRRVVFVSTLAGIVVSVLLWFAFDDVAQGQHDHSTTSDTFVRVARSIVSPNGILFTASYAAMVFIPLAVAALFTRRPRVV